MRSPFIFLTLLGLLILNGCGSREYEDRLQQRIDELKSGVTAEASDGDEEEALPDEGEVDEYGIPLQ